MEDDFFEKNSSKLFWITILIAVVIRLYFFILTRNQALWWDEAEYMLISKIWAGLIPDVGWFGGRPLLLPFIGFLFYKLKLNGEFAVRTIEFLLSILGVLLIYFIGKMFYNKKIGIIAAFIG
nr:glycosyltransferase family 39 protein [Candidatus Woesearchaeota archaeon]